MDKQKQIKLLSIIVALALLLAGCGLFGETAPSADTESGLTIYFIDVGQADSALVLCDGAAMLIDGGNAADSALVYTFLKDRGIDTLDYLVATHAHEDHVGGLAGALNYATAKTALCPVTEYDSKASFTVLIIPVCRARKTA